MATYTFTFSISNRTLDEFGSAFSRLGSHLAGPQTQSAPGSEIGGPIPTD